MRKIVRRFDDELGDALCLFFTRINPSNFCPMLRSHFTHNCSRYVRLAKTLSARNFILFECKLLWKKNFISTILIVDIV